jgi:hypothetical protein
VFYDERIVPVQLKFFIFFNWYSGGEVESNWVHSALRPTVPALGDYDDGEIGGMMIGRGNRINSEKTCLSTALSTTNPTCCPGCRGGKPTTNSLSYGTALPFGFLQIKVKNVPVLN